MQIVIEIPDDYKRVIDNLMIDGKGYLLPSVVEDRLAKAVTIGTPLPKGHGRLIDADALYDEYVKEPEEFNGGHSLMALFRAALTIIEADNVESEDKK